MSVINIDKWTSYFRSEAERDEFLLMLRLRLQNSDLVILLNGEENIGAIVSPDLAQRVLVARIVSRLVAPKDGTQ